MSAKDWFVLIYGLGAIAYLIYAIRFYIKSKRQWEQPPREPSREINKLKSIQMTNGVEIGGLCQWCENAKNCSYKAQIKAKIDRPGHRVVSCYLFKERKRYEWTDI